MVFGTCVAAPTSRLKLPLLHPLPLGEGRGEGAFVAITAAEGTLTRPAAGLSQRERQFGQPFHLCGMMSAKQDCHPRLLLARAGDRRFTSATSDNADGFSGLQIAASARRQTIATARPTRDFPEMIRAEYIAGLHSRQRMRENFVQRHRDRTRSTNPIAHQEFHHANHDHRRQPPAAE